MGDKVRIGNQTKGKTRCSSQPTVTKHNNRTVQIPGESNRDWVRGENPKELDNQSRIVEEKTSFETRVSGRNLVVVG